jgi:hypothetical protein
MPGYSEKEADMAGKRKSHGKTVAKPQFAGRSYTCSGKRVRTGKGKKKAPRVFCRTEKKSKKK